MRRAAWLVVALVVGVLAVALCAPADAAGAAAKGRRRVPMDPPPRADLALVTIKEVRVRLGHDGNLCSC